MFNLAFSQCLFMTWWQMEVNCFNLKFSENTLCAYSVIILNLTSMFCPVMKMQVKPNYWNSMYIYVPLFFWSFPQVNIIPIIAKADTISKSELHKFKIKIMSELVSNGVQIYQFPTDDEAVSEINASMNVSHVVTLQQTQQTHSKILIHSIFYVFLIKKKKNFNVFTICALFRWKKMCWLRKIPSFL